MAHFRNIYFVKMFSTNLKHIHSPCQKEALIFCCNYVHIKFLQDKSPLRPTFLKDQIETIKMNMLHKNSQRNYSDKIDHSCENKTFLNSYGAITNGNGVSLCHKETNKTQFGQKNYLTFMKFNRRKSYPNLILENLEELTLLSLEKKQLSEHLQNWDLQKASEQFKSLLNNGVVPDRQLVLNLVEHLAFLGGVEELLALKELLKVHHLVSNVDFLKCLHYAYCNSGRVAEGIAMIKLVFDAVPNGTHTELEADIFFNLLTTKVITHFPHRMNLIIKFIEEFEKTHEDSKSLRSSLWCCYVQAERFSLADAMLQDDDKLTKMVPAQVTKLIQCLDSLDFNIDGVFIWLLQQQYIKQRLKYSLFDALLLYKCKTEDWNGVLNYLQYAKSQDIKIHKQTLEYFLSKFLNEFPERRLEQLTFTDKTVQDS